MILSFIVIASLVSVGFQFSIEPDMILQEYKHLLTKLTKWRIGDFRGGHWLAKPLGYCITCNSHWIGFILFAFNKSMFATDTVAGKWVTIEFSSLAVCGLSTLIWFIYNKIKNAL